MVSARITSLVAITVIGAAVALTHVVPNGAPDARAPWCGTTDSPELVLSEVTRVPSIDGVPAGLVAIDSASVWVLSQVDRRVRRVSTWNQSFLSGGPSDSGISVVGAGRGRLLAIRDTTILALTPPGVRFERIGSFSPRAGRPAGIAETAGQIWLVQWTDRVATLRALHVTAEGLAVQRDTVALQAWRGGAVSLHATAPNTLIAAAIRAPFALQVLDSVGHIAARAAPFEVRGDSTVAEVSSATVVSLSAMPLDCGRILQVLADLRGDARHFIVFGDSPLRVVRRRRVETPIGIVQTFPAQRLAIGYADVPSQSGVVIYRWRWN
ncbi:MAG TPA: hypothetical protein VJR92_06760 [Gemmatimonadaceae bacterium]|nr:hypothetical protein [Gemmatimonadaceae bacterium]